MITKGKSGTRLIIIASPFSLDGASDDDYKAPNLLQRILGLFKNVGPGSDLTRLQLPPHFNMPKSQLQCFGETVYSVGSDMLGQCARGETSLDRFISVVAWSISTLRPPMFGVAPYNPVLGETHHVSRGTLNVLLEQVSHHPPVSALHATDEEQNLEMAWCQYPVPKFNGTSVETEVRGIRELKLLKEGESYVMNSPKLVIRFLPTPRADWVGDVRIRCEETNLEAELCYKGGSLFGRRGSYRSVKGRIFDSLSLKTIYEIDGNWDRTVQVKDIKEGKIKEIYNAKEAICGLKTPIIKDYKAVWQSESAAIWSEVSEGILSRDWEKARVAKKAVEEKERDLLRERESRGETWLPKHFTLSHTQEGGWLCSPIHKRVPPAPVGVPL